MAARLWWTVAGGLVGGLLAANVALAQAEAPLATAADEGVEEAVAGEAPADEPPAGEPLAREGDVAGPDEPLADGDVAESDARAPRRGIEEITVTAQKREQSLQDVPAAVSAFTGSDLDDTGVYQMQDLAFQVPNLHYGQEQGAARITIRGVSTAVGSDQATAFHIDGVYQNDAAVGTALTFYDVQRVEVLRGPQGTLYGRNATGGAINVISNPPTFDFDFFGDVQVGNYEQVIGRGAVNVPLVEDMLAVRLSGFYEKRNGYQKNGTIPGPIDDADDADDLGLRVQLLYQPMDDLDVTLRFNYFRKRGVGYALKQLGPIPYAGVALDTGGFLPPGILFPLYEGATPNPADVRRVNLDVAGQLDANSIGANVEIRYDVGALPGLGASQLKVIGSYVDRDSFAVNDQDATDANVVRSLITQNTDLPTGDGYEWVTEINWSSLGGGTKGEWDWVIGVFGFGTSGDQYIDAPANIRLPNQPPIPPDSIISVGVEQYFMRSSYSFAAFGDVGYMITDALRLGLGFRYSQDWKSATRINRPTDLDLNPIGLPVVLPLFDPVNDPRSGSWGRPSGTIGLDYQMLDEAMIYGKFSTGYKSGNLVNDIPILGGGAFEGYEVDPEDIYALEFGLKQTLLDGRLRLSTAFFNYWYSNLQVSQLFESQNVIRNAADARTFGAELEAMYRPWDELTLVATFSYLDAKFGSFVGCPSALDPFNPDIDCTGNTLPRSPQFTGSFIGQYDFDLGRYGTFTPLLQVFASSQVFLQASNLPIDTQPAYALLNVRFMWRSAGDNVSVEAFIDNLTDEDVFTTQIVGSSLLGAPVYTAYDRPRTAGIRVGLHW